MIFFSVLTIAAVFVECILAQYLRIKFKRTLKLYESLNQRWGFGLNLMFHIISAISFIRLIGITTVAIDFIISGITLTKVWELILVYASESIPSFLFSLYVYRQSFKNWEEHLQKYADTIGKILKITNEHSEINQAELIKEYR